MSDYLDRQHKNVYCDSCKQAIDQDLEPGRFRHAACPVPPLPPAALAVLEQVANRRKSKR